MNTQRIIASCQNTGAVASLVAASTLTMSVLAPSASAVSLVPQTEAEINVGLGCIDPSRCLSDLTAYLIGSVVSETDATSGTKSRLFVDNLATFSQYGGITFQTSDQGTNPLNYWFRPSEAGSNGAVGEENGQLEVGTFTFNFLETIQELTVAYFDTERSDQTGVLAINGSAIVPGTFVSGAVPQGPNSNIFAQTFTNVNSITLKLGQDFAQGTGDGVDFQLNDNTQSVPEPGTVGALFGAGILALVGRRCKGAARVSLR